MKLVLVILAVSNVERAAAFYKEALGWKKTADVPVYVELEGPRGERLGLYERHAFAKNVGHVPIATQPGELSPAELYFYTDDLDAACARLTKAGARLLSPRAPRGWGDEVAYFADHDGNVVAAAMPPEEDRVP